MDVGEIYFVRSCPDKQGGNNKDRRCMVVKVDGDKCALVAITSSFDPNMLTPSQINLPYQNPGSKVSCCTSLNKPSVVDCQWVVVAPVSDLGDKIGYIPKKLVAAILLAMKQSTDQNND